jgi:class 3 adenylate cyclase
VHVAARVGAAAEGEEILATAAALAEPTSSRYALSEARSLRLKGLQEPVEVRSIAWRV